MRYLLRRAGFYLIALWAAVSFNFIIPRLMPGDPAEAYIARLQTQQVTRAQIDAIRAEFGVNPNTPIWKQYGEYLNGLLHGNLGISTSQFPSQVVDILRQSLPWTIGLVGGLEAWFLVRYRRAPGADISFFGPLFLDGSGAGLPIWC